jgi:hypothetical protein
MSISYYFDLVVIDPCPDTTIIGLAVPEIFQFQGYSVSTLNTYSFIDTESVRIESINAGI